MSYERDEGASAVVFKLIIILSSYGAHHVLGLARVAHRDDQAPPDLQLREQRLGHSGRTGGGQDSVIRSMRAPAQRSVKAFYSGVVYVQAAYACLRLSRKLGYALYRVDLRGQSCQHRCLIAGARAYLKDSLGALQFEQLRHVRDYKGLRDGLICVNRQRVVAVGAGLQGFGHKEMARQGQHGIQNATIPYAVMAAQALYHTLARNAITRRGRIRPQGRRTQNLYSVSGEWKNGSLYLPFTSLVALRLR